MGDLLKKLAGFPGKGVATVDEDEADKWDIEDSSRVIRGDLNTLLAGRKRMQVEARKTFLPRILQRQSVGSSQEVIMHKCTGCVVFSDASGFTQLTEKLAQRSDGAEVLSKCLNKFFTPLIGLIEAYRGDVIKFSGDALSILFEAVDDYKLHPCPCGSPEAEKKTPQQLACLRASACCLEIHKRLHNFDTGIPGVLLTLHIGVGAGDITILQVGGEFDRYEYVIAGAPMAQISIAEPLAGSGETVLSPQTWKEVEYTVVEGEILHEKPDYHRLFALDTKQHTYPTVKQAAIECGKAETLQETPFSDSTLMGLGYKFIPRAVLKHLWSGNSSSINEMRSVTIIFANISGVDVSTNDGSALAQKLIEAMQRACYRYEGNMNKFLVDDKGLLFLFVFGFPPLVHIDDPSRAIQSCWDMIDDLQTLGLKGHFGITTGRVFCGIVGSDARREYTVMGDTVNLSARLMANAKANTVLIDEATHARSKTYCGCRKLEPIKVKGKAHLIPIFAPEPPVVYGLQVKQLGNFLNQRSWNMEQTELQVTFRKDEPPSAVTMPWRASSHLLGGPSPMLKLTRWRELQRVEKMLSEPGSFLTVGGSFNFLGKSGIGKRELTEYVVHRALQAGHVPVFGHMRCRPPEHWRAVAELLQNCICSLRPHGRPCDDMPDKMAEEILRGHVKESKMAFSALAFLGFSSFTTGPVPTSPSDAELRELEEGAAEVVASLVTALATSRGVVVVLRILRGTDIFDALKGKATSFWCLRRVLAELAQKRQAEITAGGSVHPILVVTLARHGPEAGSPEQAVSGLETSPAAAIGSSEGWDSERNVDSRELTLKPLTEDAAVELMCHCLDLTTAGGGELVKRKLRDFVIAVSICMPTYIQECLEHLAMESAVRVSSGECSIEVDDLNTVNIAEWVDTAMVGGTISLLESLGSAKQHIMKLATVFENTFSPLDLAAANRVLFGKTPRILAFYDLAKLLTCCNELVEVGYLRRVRLPSHATPADRAPLSVPRWTISNSLIRKVAGSMVLNSQRMLIKRAVLIDRALNVSLPKRMGLSGRQVGRKSVVSSRHGENKDKDAGGAKGQGADRRKGDSSPFPSPAAAKDEGTDSMDLLISACALGNASVALEILGGPSGIDVNKAGDANGYTPLHFACSSGDMEIVKSLCEHGATVDTRSAKMETPIFIAAQRGHLEVVQYLCETHNVLMSHQQDSLDFWEKSLPEISSEEDIPRPLAPSFQVASLTQDMLNTRRKEVGSWLASYLTQGDVSLDAGSDPEDGRISSPDDGTGRAVSEKEGAVVTCVSGVTADAEGAPKKRTSLQDSAEKRRTSVAPGKVAMAPDRSKTSNVASQKGGAVKAKVRAVLRGKQAVGIMLIGLALALYMPDIWVSAGAAGNLGIDVVLALVMSLFLTELMLLSVCDASYPFSFFFFMDCIGTVSMIWDISFLLGDDAQEVKDGSASDSDLTIFRATRTAKIASRAGRLSRLVKVMKFLPGMGGSRGKQANEAEKLQQISNQLTNVLSKRVACLTILLVIVMPCFTIGLYPEADYSMNVWVDSLSRRVLARDAPGLTADQEAALDRGLQASLLQFSVFYVDKSYGPYEVCITAERFDSACYNLQSDLHVESPFRSPGRRSFQLDVSSEQVRASFDNSGPSKAEANMGIALITLVIILMCGACILLNYSASELAVRPLERMLMSIKDSARLIFSSVNALRSEDAEEDFGEDMDGEVALLERVVKKIAMLAELSSKRNPFDEASLTGMKSEELGVLAQCASHVQTKSVHLESDEVVEPGNFEVTVTMQWQLEEIGIAYRTLNSWDFNVLDLDAQKQEQISQWLLMNNPGSCGYTEHNVDAKKLRSFVDQVCKGYLGNEYHGFPHAVDVTHTVFRYMTLMQAEQLFSMLEQFSVLVASVCHDLGHIGLNNGFLTEVQHDLAIRYNDKSPLENMHCCKLFEIISQPSVNVFQSVSQEQYRDVRKLIIDVILHTDIVLHFSMVKELELLYEMNSKVFEANTSRGLTEQEVEILSQGDNKRLVAKVILHAADTANPTKPWGIARAWAFKVLDEYFAQGDREKKLGMPVQMLNDRDKVNKPSSQIGFIEFIIAPFLSTYVKLFPSWFEVSLHLEANINQWEQLYIQESSLSSSSEPSIEKLQERVQKICTTLGNLRFSKGNADQNGFASARETSAGKKSGLKSAIRAP